MFVKGDDILKESFPDGARVRFACDIGYTPATGSPFVTCKAGNWSRLTLRCQSEYQPFRFCIIYIYLSIKNGENCWLGNHSIQAADFATSVVITWRCKRFL